MPSPTENRAPVQAVRPTDKEVLDVLAPFANYMNGGLDLNFHGDPLPDGQGVGWVYLTHGDFRRARDLHARLSQSTEAGPAACVSSVKGNDACLSPNANGDTQAALLYQTAPSVSSQAGNDTQVARPATAQESETGGWRVPDGHPLVIAAREVLSHRVGELPGKGWLRDNAGSRSALANLGAALIVCASSTDGSDQ